MSALRLRRVGQRRLQVAAVDRQIRRAIAPLGVVPSGMRTISRPEPPAITRIACGVTTEACSRSRKPSAISTRVALGESWMPAPVSSSFCRLLQHCDAQAGARQRQRRRQPGNAGAGDDDMTRGRQGLASSGIGSGGGGERQRAFRRPRACESSAGSWR